MAHTSCALALAWGKQCELSTQRRSPFSRWGVLAESASYLWVRVARSVHLTSDYKGEVTEVFAGQHGGIRAVMQWAKYFFISLYDGDAATQSLYLIVEERSH